MIYSAIKYHQKAKVTGNRIIQNSQKRQFSAISGFTGFYFWSGKYLAEDAGYEPVGPVSQVMTAIGVALKEFLDAALLDVDLEGQSAQPVAEILARRGIPFAVVTSYDRARLPTAMRGHPYIRKPFTDGEIKAVVAGMCANSGTPSHTP